MYNDTFIDNIDGIYSFMYGVNQTLSGIPALSIILIIYCLIWIIGLKLDDTKTKEVFITANFIGLFLAFFFFTLNFLSYKYIITMLVLLLVSLLIKALSPKAV